MVHQYCNSNINTCMQVINAGIVIHVLLYCIITSKWYRLAMLFLLVHVFQSTEIILPFFQRNFVEIIRALELLPHIKSKIPCDMGKLHHFYEPTLLRSIAHRIVALTVIPIIYDVIAVGVTGDRNETDANGLWLSPLL